MKTRRRQSQLQPIQLAFNAMEQALSDHPAFVRHRIPAARFSPRFKKNIEDVVMPEADETHGRRTTPEKRSPLTDGDMPDAENDSNVGRAHSPVSVVSSSCTTPPKSGWGAIRHCQKTGRVDRLGQISAPTYCYTVSTCPFALCGSCKPWRRSPTAPRTVSGDRAGDDLLENKKKDSKKKDSLNNVYYKKKETMPANASKLTNSQAVTAIVCYAVTEGHAIVCSSDRGHALRPSDIVATNLTNAELGQLDTLNYSAQLFLKCERCSNTWCEGPDHNPCCCFWTNRNSGNGKGKSGGGKSGKGKSDKPSRNNDSRERRERDDSRERHSRNDESPQVRHSRKPTVDRQHRRVSQCVNLAPAVQEGA